MAQDTLSRIDALLQVALRLARSAPSGRIALAQVVRAIELEWIPSPWGDPIVSELQAAADSCAEPLPFKQVERILQDAWGVRPSDELDDLQREPVQVMPAAQVHRGELEGEPVAVKVLRPGLPSLVRQDLTLLEGLAGPIRAAFPAVDAGALLHEVRERVLDELDLETQSHAQRRFHRALRDHPVFVVPAPITRLAHDSVLVTEWVEGTPLPEAPDPDDVAAKLVLFALGAAQWGTVHADLHPQEVLALPDGRIAIVDFNSTRSVERDRLETATRLLEAFVDEDLETVAAALAELGWLPADLAETVDDLVRYALGPFAGSDAVRLDSEAVIEVRDRLFSRPADLMAILSRGSVAPEDLWPARALGQLFSTIARTGATAPWRELVRVGLREGWDARVPS